MLGNETKGGKLVEVDCIYNREPFKKKKLWRYSPAPCRRLVVRAKVIPVTGNFNIRAFGILRFEVWTSPFALHEDIFSDKSMFRNTLPDVFFVLFAKVFHARKTLNKS